MKYVLIKGSTLVEALIATLIILMVIGISALVVGKSLNQNSDFPHLLAQSTSDSLYYSLLDNDAYSDFTFFNNTLKYDVSFKPYMGFDDVLQVHIDVKNDSGEEVISFKYLMSVKQ